MLALLGGLAVTLVVVVVLALTGDDDDSASAPAPTPTPPEQAGSGEGGALRALGGSRASGSARIDGRRLVLDVRGLPTPARGGYVVWLYDSITEARALAGFRRGQARVTARLPANFSRYRFIDVSREAADGNPNHSGESVLRVPLPAASQ